ncbi:ABC transporter permease subunit [Paracoccus denitrificans]|uniref:ABC transporter permease n=1 Tax=Paracoccus denitrificans TaxID=266 RepID=UPI001E3FBDF8|nr:ABC transporter permease subunit [Paracoccus denitrificans]UFS64893.1 ABC transporter permease subunit [Paracoccus denitrificans]
MSATTTDIPVVAKTGWTRTQWAGAAILVAIIGFAVLAPLLFPADPLRQSLRNILGGADAVSPLGYDHLGRSLTARLAAALRLSLLIAAAAVAASAVLGVAVGVLAAWRGGWIDRAAALVADSFLALPGLLMVLIVSGIVPNTPTAFWIGLTLVLWIEYFRLTRATVSRLVAAPGVQASRLLGFGPVYVFRRHLWPELAPMLLTVAAFGAATAIMMIAALGFVSVGMRPPTPELGLMMIEMLPYYREAPMALLTPVLATFLTLLGLNLIAGGRRA